MKQPHHFIKVLVLVLLGLLVATAFGMTSMWGSARPTVVEETLDPALVAKGKQIFRYDTFGDEAYWTDTLRMHEVITRSVSPATALKVGLKVDVDVLPQAMQAAITSGQIDLNDPATTIALLKLNAVLGLKGTVRTVGEIGRASCREGGEEAVGH